MTISLEKVFFAFILENKKYFEIIETNYFKNNEIQFVYNVIKKYMKKTPEAEVPSPRQILEMVSLEDKDGIITKDILKSMLTTNLQDYDEQNFILPKLNTWILSNKIKNGTIDIVDETRNVDAIVDFDSAMESASKIKLIVEQMSNIGFTNDEDLGKDFDDAESHVQDNDRYKVKSGFDTLDHMLGGGWDISTLNILMGETNNGKCCIGLTNIKVKDTKTNKIISINLETFFTKISKGDNNF